MEIKNKSKIHHQKIIEKELLEVLLSAFEFFSKVEKYQEFSSNAPPVKR